MVFAGIVSSSLLIIYYFVHTFFEIAQSFSKGRENDAQSSTSTLAKYWQLFIPGILVVAFLVMLADNYSQTGTIKLTLVAGTMIAFAGFIVLKRSIK